LHIRFGFAVLGVELLFLFRELAAFLFERVHLGELGPAEDGFEVGTGRPVKFNIRLMLRKKKPENLPNRAL